MPGGRKSSQVAERLMVDEEIMRLHLKGLNQTEIAAELGFKAGQGQVSRTLTRMRKTLAESNIASTEIYRNKEAAKLDLIEREAWIAWEASKGDPLKPQGDGSFLQLIGATVSKRCKLFGLDIPVLQKQEVLQLGGPSLPESERAARLAGLLDAGRARAGASNFASNGAVIDAEVVDGQVH